MLPHNYSESVGGQNELKFMASMGDNMTIQPMEEHSNAGAGDSHVISRTQLGLVDIEQQNVQGQGLSLSLGTVMQSVPSFQYQYPGSGFTSLMSSQIPNLKGTEDEANLHKELRNAECMTPVSSGGFHKREDFYNPHQSDPYLHGAAGFSANNVMNSQYLKVAQELLDEIVNVRKPLKPTGLEKQQSFREIGLDGSKDSDGKSTSQSMQMSSGPNGSTANSSCELSPAERQHLLDKKTKLLSMLDEVKL